MTELKAVKERALVLLARREFSANELRQRLLEKTTEVASVDKVIQELLVANLLSDERFVASYVRRRAAKGFGPLHIECELKKHHLHTDLIRQHLHGNEVHWSDVLKRLFERKYHASRLAKDRSIRSKQVRFLQSRGFELAQINHHLTESINEE